MKIGRSKASRKWAPALRRAILAILAIPALYLIAAVIGSLVPRNADWKEPREGILVFVRTNGVHADIVLPASAAGLDLYRLVPPDDIIDSGKADGWLAFGWGQREFYLETPRWADLTVRNALRSVFGGDALMHVEHLGRPSVSGAMRPIRLHPRSYRRLVASVARDFVVDGSGRTVPLRGRGYGSADIFYEARGRYSGLKTSNQWTADRLAEAGVEIGVWTPFAQGIMWRFRDARGAEPEKSSELSSAFVNALARQSATWLRPPAPAPSPASRWRRGSSSRRRGPTAKGSVTTELARGDACAGATHLRRNL